MIQIEMSNSMFKKLYNIESIYYIYIYLKISNSIKQRFNDII